jgi:hypothetical protein
MSFNLNLLAAASLVNSVDLSSLVTSSRNGIVITEIKDGIPSSYLLQPINVFPHLAQVGKETTPAAPFRGDDDPLLDNPNAFSTSSYQPKEDPAPLPVKKEDDPVHEPQSAAQSPVFLPTHDFQPETPGPVLLQTVEPRPTEDLVIDLTGDDDHHSPSSTRPSRAIIKLEVENFVKEEPVDTPEKVPEKIPSADSHHQFQPEEESLPVPTLVNQEEENVSVSALVNHEEESYSPQSCSSLRTPSSSEDEMEDDDDDLSLPSINSLSDTIVVDAQPTTSPKPSLVVTTRVSKGKTVGRYSERKIDSFKKRAEIFNVLIERLQELRERIKAPEWKMDGVRKLDLHSCKLFANKSGTRVNDFHLFEVVCKDGSVENIIIRMKPRGVDKNQHDPMMKPYIIERRDYLKMVDTGNNPLVSGVYEEAAKLGMKGEKDFFSFYNLFRFHILK